MHDSYLLLTPLLTLLLVALVGFVGCGFTAGTIPDPQAPTNLMAVWANNRVDLSWDQVGYVSQYIVKRGTASNMYDTTFPLAGPATSYTDTTIVSNGTTYFYAVAAESDEYTSNEAQVVAGTAPLDSLITSFAPGTLRNNFGGWVGFGFRVGAAPIVVKSLGRFKVAGNSGEHSVKLVDGATKVDVPGASVLVKLVAGTSGQFAYVTLNNPVTLASGGEYYLISEEATGGDQWYDADTTVVTSNAVVNEFAVNGDGAGNYTIAPVSGFAYGPVDLQY